MLTKKQLKKLIHYNPDSGVFTWRSRSEKLDRHERSWNSRFAGQKAGCLDVLNGYIKITINYKEYSAHRLAFLYVFGRLPQQIDHINHDRSNNAISNIREVSPSINSKNLSLGAANKSGFTGIKPIKYGKWEAGIRVNSKLIYLGRHKNLSDAVKARVDADIKYGFHDNHGC